MSASNNFLSDQISSSTAFKLVSNQVARTTSSPAAVASTSNQNANNSMKQSVDSFLQPIESKNSHQKNSLCIGNYLLYEPESINDTFGTAIKNSCNQKFYWKVMFV